MEQHLNSRDAKKVSRITTGHLPELEAALSQYMLERMVYMKGESLFRADVVSKSALQIRVKLVTKLESLKASTSEVRLKTDYDIQIKSLKEFKASQAWIANFMKRKGFHSSKGLGESGHVDANTISEAQDKMQKKLAIFDISNISNTDEVTVLYWSFLNRAIRSGTSDLQTS